MSNEVAENLREIASNLLAAANRLDGIDVTADAMRSGTATPEQAQAYLDDLLRTHRPDLAPVTGGTVCVDSGDGMVTYQYNAVLSVPSGFAVGADRDGTVGMRCLLGGWCSWEYEPEDNELTTEQFAQQATAHVAEKHSPGA